MIAKPASLRARLLLLILIPLVAISILAGYWRITTATKTAEELFDRTLMATTLAISRDVAVSGGDAISSSTHDLIRSSSGGEVFYHVHGPDGVFVTGYATPPVAPRDLAVNNGAPTLFLSRYRGEEVRVARLREYVTIDTISGYSTITVWQTMAARQAFARDLAGRAAIVMGSLILTVVLVVWFGINLGLKPLTDLQQAISIRSSDDLSRIRRPIPREVSGIVRTLNGLFDQVTRAFASRDAFISDAAHQLRNPIAGVLSIAESVRDARSDDARLSRTEDLVAAAKHVARLTQQLLSLERAKGRTDPAMRQVIDLNALVRAVCERNAKRVLDREIDFEFVSAAAPAPVHGDPVFLEEAVENLIDNALVHGGPKNTKITVTVSAADTEARVTVSDTGVGIEPEDAEIAFSRFGQVRPAEGSGLGLAIVVETAQNHGGSVCIDESDIGARISIRLPIATSGPESQMP